jgi:hypothetical protein
MRLDLLHESSDHTCRLQYRKPDDDNWARRNRKVCKACALEYEREEDDLDSGFIGDIPKELEPKPAPSKADIQQQILDLVKMDPRREHKPGPFGTGRPASIKPTDSSVVAGIKAIRDKNLNVDPATGIGKVKKYRDTCGYQHTCTSHPSGRPAWNYPMPDPLATKTTGKQRYNWMFKYNPTSIFRWPVSGMIGFEPKDEYRDYVMSKLKCPVCSGEVEGCKNPVAQEYTAQKPFCTEHLEESPYPKELMAKYGGKGLPGAPDPSADYRETEKAWKKTRSKYIERGDKVKLGKQTGEVLEVDSEMEDRTHRVRWDNPKAEALRITWVDPDTLDLVH